jgi:hypothetical protein
LLLKIALEKQIKYLVDYVDRSLINYTMEQETFLKMLFQVFVFPNRIYSIEKKKE